MKKRQTDFLTSFKNLFHSSVTKQVLCWRWLKLCGMTLCWNGKGLIAVPQLKDSNEEHNMLTSLTASLWPENHLKENKAAFFEAFFFFFSKRQTVNSKSLGPVLLDHNFTELSWIVRGRNLSHYCNSCILNCKTSPGTCKNLVYTWNGSYCWKIKSFYPW